MSYSWSYSDRCCFTVALTIFTEDFPLRVTEKVKMGLLRQLLAFKRQCVVHRCPNKHLLFPVSITRRKPCTLTHNVSISPDVELGEITVCLQGHACEFQIIYDFPCIYDVSNFNSQYPLKEHNCMLAVKREMWSLVTVGKTKAKLVWQQHTTSFWGWLASSRALVCLSYYSSLRPSKFMYVYIGFGDVTLQPFGPLILYIVSNWED